MPLLPAPAQVVAGGNSVVATTVAGLGAGSDGKQGLLRIGGGSTAPFFDELAVVFDNTYGKWVSAPTESNFMSWARRNASGDADVTAAISGVGAGAPLMQPFAARLADYNTAGLIPQLRVIATMMGEGTGFTMTWKLWTASANDGAAGPAGGSTTNWTTQWTSGAISIGSSAVQYATRSGWQSVATTALTNDILFAKLSVNNSSATACDVAAQVELRWVSA